jgi:putative phosphoesterase
MSYYAERMPTTVGVISDTHGLLRKEALDALAEVALIIHAGDVGSPEILERLSTIAPVHAVRGNVDVQAWARPLPLSTEVKVERARLYVLHNIADLDFDPAARRYSAVIFGHSHKPGMESKNGVLYLNPGSAGPRRFRLPIALARMAVDGESVRAELVHLRVQ